MRTTFNGVRIEAETSPIEMPWGSVYWLAEAHLERPILPTIFRRIGEPNWAAIEPTLDAAVEKLQEYITEALA